MLRPPPTSGAEPIALRDELLRLTYECPRRGYLCGCPFLQLHGISHTARQSILDRLNESALLGLFDLVPTCTCPADIRQKRTLSTAVVSKT